MESLKYNGNKDFKAAAKIIKYLEGENYRRIALVHGEQSHIPAMLSMFKSDNWSTEAVKAWKKAIRKWEQSLKSEDSAVIFVRPKDKEHLFVKPIKSKKTKAKKKANSRIFKKKKNVKVKARRPKALNTIKPSVKFEKAPAEKVVNKKLQKNSSNFNNKKIAALVKVTTFAKSINNKPTDSKE